MLPRNTINVDGHAQKHPELITSGTSTNLPRTTLQLKLKIKPAFYFSVSKFDIF
jgi:hypothetical protein